jgi:hypothetical protein
MNFLFTIRLSKFAVALSVSFLGVLSKARSGPIIHVRSIKQVKEENTGASFSKFQALNSSNVLGRGII